MKPKTLWYENNSNRVFKGRTPIFSTFKSEELLDVNNVVDLINTAMNTHIYNSNEIEYLYNYYKGVQPILNKKTISRPEINNILLINHAHMITRTISNYFVGTPIQYTQSGYGDLADDENKRVQVERLNSYLEFGNSAGIDLEVAECQSVCGTAYRIIITSDDEDLPFIDKFLQPSTTFVVYENTVVEEPLAGITYIPINSADGFEKYRYECYTKYGLYVFEGQSLNLTLDSYVEFIPYDVGGIPLIEYPNNRHRIGDWELVMGIMDNISLLYSNRVDDIEQIVQALLVFINADIDLETYDEMREKGIISLVNRSNESKSEVKSITNPLDQTGVGELSKELIEMLYSLVGIPSRDNRSAGGGDTGTAVELRDGWADLENVVRSKEINFKRCERKKLKIITSILNKKFNFNLKPNDMLIKFSRNKNNNLLVKAQSLINLISTKTIAPIDALQISDLTTDATDVINRAMSFWGDEFAGKSSYELYDVETPENENDNDVEKDKNETDTNIEKNEK